MKTLLNPTKRGNVYLTLMLGFLLVGCGGSFLAGYERDIASATREIESARDDAHRAEAYTKRGAAYSEKARYSRFSKLISREEYARLFGLAMKDHGEAIALNPASAEAYFTRGQAYYDRAVQEVIVNGTLVGSPADCRFWFDPAVADFRKAIEKNARHSLAWDRLGLIHETTGELDQAIAEYTQEVALDHSMRSRLAEAYCTRGSIHEGKKENDAAISDYETAITSGSIPDGCNCDPYGQLSGLYEKDKRYEQAWVVVRQALSAGKWIAPDFLDLLRKESGRRN